MTSQEIARRIQADLGPTWPRNRTLPNNVLTPLCEALWEEGVIPNRRIVQRCLPGWNEHAMGPGRGRLAPTEGVAATGSPRSARRADERDGAGENR